MDILNTFRWIGSFHAGGMSRHFGESSCPRYIQINNCHNNPFRECLLSFAGAFLFTLTSNTPPSLDYCGSLRWDRQPWLFMNTICTDTIYLGLIIWENRDEGESGSRTKPGCNVDLSQRRTGTKVRTKDALKTETIHQFQFLYSERIFICVSQILGKRQC